jgi:hypothetical protein
MLVVGFAVLHDDWPEAGISSIAYDSSLDPATDRRFAVDPIWLTALGEGTDVHFAQ